MKCPFCDDFEGSEEEVKVHIGLKHPELASVGPLLGIMEKMFNEQRVKDSRERLYELAAILTTASVEQKGEDPKVVLERLRFFVKELSGLFLDSK
jgi:hypothetical protein